ncbi:MAG: hypothetical protein GY778_07610 [bacterium]|nr:hypothetical protein [bacterium]
MRGIKTLLSLVALLTMLGFVGACNTTAPGGGGGDGGEGEGEGEGEPDDERVAGLVAEIELTAEELAKFEEDNAECLVCHDNPDMGNPRMIEDFKFSRKAKKGVKCVDCHAENEGVAAGNEGHRLLPTPETCGACHPNQYKGHRQNRHSIAYIRMLECGRFDDFPKEYGAGSGYHVTDEDVEQIAEFHASAGHLAPADEVAFSVQMCGQCHVVENRCDSCHFRHRFAPEEARDPMACATCHMGPDHPQIEMYQHSKHGARFEVYGDTGTVPVCVDCHMPYNTQMLGKKTAETVGPDGLTEYTDHNLALGIAYGPVGGGTTRKGLTLDGPTDRVKFNARDTEADYPDGVWLERADGRFYDAAEGGEAVYDDLAEMAFADADDDGKQDYVVDQPADDADTLLAQRTFMRDQVCGTCHSNNFADEQLLVADLIHQRTKDLQNEAFDAVRAMAIVSRLHVNADQRPGNPETGTTGLYGANMVLRNIDTNEQIYFQLMKYSNVKTWKGAYHQNPDYTHWYGWQELQMHMGDLFSEATDLVLTGMWMNGVPYPEAGTGDLVVDGFYQGVIFESGGMANIYDKFPGPGDPGADADIDVDMDGVPEFVAVEGSPGTFTYGVDAAEITFH